MIASSVVNFVTNTDDNENKMISDEIINQEQKPVEQHLASLKGDTFK